MSTKAVCGPEKLSCAPSQPGCCSSKGEAHFDESSVVAWIERWSKQLTLLLVSGLLGVSLLGYYYVGAEKHAEMDYLAAEQQFLLLQQALESDKPEQSRQLAAKAFRSLEQLVEKYPSLQARYDGPTAQLLSAMGMAQEAGPLLARSWERIAKSHLPDLIAFGQVSHLVDGADHKPALEASDLLTSSWSTSPVDRLPLMATYAKVRQLLLASATEPRDKELQVEWEQLVQGLAEKSNRSLEQIAALLADGDVLFESYAAEQAASF